jgi:glycosyltransferase involved in cell wall biosynthesis
MRIGLDVRYLSHGLVGGVHTFLKQLIPALIREGVGHEIYLYADQKSPFELSDLPNHVSLRLLPYRNLFSSIYHDFNMWKWMENDRVDVIHFTGNYGFAPSRIPTVITLQDEINLTPLPVILGGHRKTLRNLFMMTYLHYCTSKAIPKTDRLVTISEYSKKQILQYSSIDGSIISIIPHACPEDMKRVTEEDVINEVLGRLNLFKPFILAEAFKNPGVIVRAWDLLPDHVKNNMELVFFSRSASVLPPVQAAIQKGFGHLFVRPLRSDLRVLFSKCLVFVFPSWIEGFGIPLLEAMTCGAPVIASDRGSIPEVVQDAGLILDAEDERTLAEYITRLATDSQEVEKFRNLGFRRASQFSWPDIARRYIKVYQSVVS